MTLWRITTRQATLTSEETVEADTALEAIEIVYANIDPAFAEIKASPVSSPEDVVVITIPGESGE